MAYKDVNNRRKVASWDNYILLWQIYSFFVNKKGEKFCLSQIFRDFLADLHKSARKSIIPQKEFEDTQISCYLCASIQNVYVEKNS